MISGNLHFQEVANICMAYYKLSLWQFQTIWWKVWDLTLNSLFWTGGWPDMSEYVRPLCVWHYGFDRHLQEVPSLSRSCLRLGQKWWKITGQYLFHFVQVMSLPWSEVIKSPANIHEKVLANMSSYQDREWECT